MSKFNIKKYIEETLFICSSCGNSVPYKQAYFGCKKCHGSSFKVAHRGNYPRTHPLNQLDEGDPYARQNDDGASSNNGRGGNLTRPGNEETSGGLGTRFRGTGSPTDFSRNSDDTYENERKQDIPGSHDDLLHNPPIKDDLGGWFYDPEDPLSTLSEITEDQKYPRQSLEGNLRKSRHAGNSLKRINDDSIFSRISKKQHGVN